MSEGIALHLKLEEPLLVVAMTGDPNSVVSLPFIPGSVMRGAIIARYLRRHPGVELSANPTTYRLFLDGTVRYLNAYPAQGGRRLLPTPLSWHREKDGDEAMIYDLRSQALREQMKRPVPIGQPFHHQENGSVAFYTPKRQLTIHTRRDRIAGRATKTQGDVFRYEALSPGQSFIAIILGPAELVEEIKPQEGETYFLGLSRSAGYGKTRVTKIEVLPDAWQEGEETVKEIEPGQPFSLLLLSDAVVRDEKGHPLGFLTAERIGAELGASVEPVPEETFTRVGVVGGFNRKWGMPLPQRYAARAGSVYTFKAKATIPQNKLRLLLEQGIGERRAEGFGRIALLPPPLDHPLHAEQADRRDMPSTAPWLRGSRLMETAQEQAIRHMMAERMLRHRLEKVLIQKINRITPRASQPISNAQLSTIRALVRQARLSGDVSPIRQRLETMKKEASDQFRQVKLEGKNLKEWLNDLLKETENKEAGNLVQAWLRFGKDETPPAVWNEEMAREFILRLIDGVLDVLQNPAIGKGGEG